MKYMIIDNNIDNIALYEQAGVDRLFIDLEILGKKERQGHLDTVISEHTIEDVKAVKSVVKKIKVLVRINPIHSNSAQEIKQVIDAGADIIMLPMFKTACEVANFIDLVGGRVKTSLLLETKQALCDIDDILTIPGINEIHVGLNDLHLSLKLSFMFELLSNGVVEYLASKIKQKGITFGFGGVATLDGGKIPGRLILAEHVKLQSQRVILSRTFKQLVHQDEKKFINEFNLLINEHDRLIKIEPSELSLLSDNLDALITQHVEQQCQTEIN